MLAADGSMLPSPRTISNLVHRASAQTKFERGLTTMVMQWGQFTDHDIVITPTVKGKFMCEIDRFCLFEIMLLDYFPVNTFSVMFRRFSCIH